MSADERIAAVHREAVRTEFLPAGADPIATRRLVSTFQWIGRAAMSYRPVPYPGHVTLFEATSELAEHPRPPTLGWERFVADLSHVPVDGNVFTVLQPARRQALGRALLAWAQGR